MVATYQDDTQTGQQDDGYRVDPLSLYPSAADQGKQLEQMAGGAQNLAQKTKDYVSGPTPDMFTPAPLGPSLGAAMAHNGVTVPGAAPAPSAPAPQDMNTPGVTQPNTLLGQLQAQRYNPNDPTAGNVAPDATAKLGMAAATALPAVAMGAPATAAGYGLSDLAKTAGAPGIVQQAAQFAPLFLGDVGVSPTQVAEGGIPGAAGETLSGKAAQTLPEAVRSGAYFTGGTAATQAAYDKTGLPSLDIPAIGNPIALAGGMAAAHVGAAAEGAAGRAFDRAEPVPQFRPQAPEGAFPTPLTPAPAGGAMTAAEMESRLREQGIDPAENPMINPKAGTPAAQEAAPGVGLNDPAKFQISQAWAEKQPNPDATTLSLNEMRTGLYNAGLDSNGGRDAITQRYSAAEAAGLKLPQEEPPSEMPDAYDTTMRLSPQRQEAAATNLSASPDIAAQQAPQAPRSLAPNEVGSISEASNPQPPAAQGPARMEKAPGPDLTDEELSAKIAEGRPKPRGGAQPAAYLPDGTPIADPALAAKLRENFPDKMQDVPGGANFGAQRASANAEPAQMPPGAGGGTPGQAAPSGGGSGLPPTPKQAAAAGGGIPPTPRGVDPNAWQQAVAVVRAPLRPLLAGGHVLRVGVGEITHPTEWGRSAVALAKGIADGKAGKVLSQDIEANSNASLQPGHTLADMKATMPQTTALNKAWADKVIDGIPGVGPILNRIADGNNQFLSNVRDSVYVTAAQKLERQVPNADPKMFRDLYLQLSHDTGHSTGIAGLRGNGAAQALGIGPNALAARFQSVADVFTKSGSPLPWDAGARAEAVRNLLGVAGVMALTNVVGNQLGASLNLPFGVGSIKPADIEGKYGLQSDLFKVDAVTPNGLYKSTFGGGSGYDSMFRLFGNAYLDLEQNDMKSLGRHLESWARGEAGPVPGKVIDLLRGNEYPGGPDYNFDTLKGEARTGFIKDWAPIAAQSLKAAYDAWGVKGLGLAAPSLGAYEVQTTPINSSTQAYNLAAPADVLPKAFPNSPDLQRVLNGKDWNELLPNEKAQITSVLKTDKPELAAQIEQTSRERAPAMAAHSDAVTSLKDHKTQAEDRLLDMLNSGQLSGKQVHDGMKLVQNDYFAQKDKADKDPAYVKELADLQKNGSDPTLASRTLDAYYAIGQHFANDPAQAHAEQQKYLAAIPDKDLHMRITAAVAPHGQPKLEQLYSNAAPLLSHYFGDLKGKGAQQTQERIANPKDDAILNYLGYETDVKTPAAAAILRQLTSQGAR